MFHILIVCTGNTCRSPMAEGLLRKMLATEGIDDVKVSSAGIGTLDGYPATSFGVRAAAEKDVDISHHHSTRMTSALAAEADLILTMADNHFEYVSGMDSAEGKLYMLKGFPEAGHSDYLHSVKDPVGGTLDEYRRTIDELERELLRILPHLKQRIEAART
ncbi:MAG: low molecular weight protein arginine phosphatase [bacterium]